jgi:signal transduction histidine kinase
VALDENNKPKVVASTSSDERDEAVGLAADVIRGRPPEWQDWQGSLTSFAMPVMRGETREAAVVVTMSRGAVDELRTRGRLVTLWLAPLAIIVLTILIDQVAREFIYRPLAGIHLTMQQTGMGETGARAPVLRQDELGAVALGLNQMLERIEGFNAALQERVDEATAELRTSNAERIENYQRVLSLREALARSEQLAAIGQTAASVAHQVGTPLNLVSGYVQLMLEEPDLDPRIVRRLQTVQEQIGKVADVVRRLLDRARIAAEHSPVVVDALVKRLATVATPRLDGARVRLTTDVPHGLPPVLGDETDLELALLNLVTNGIDAMPLGGELSIRAERIDRGVRLTIRDTGEGIADDVLPRIFDPWFTTKDPGRGTGLGLSIARDVIARLGGTIAVQSQRGSGTSFTIDLPAAAEDGDGEHPGA